jgi:hypothetical protein
MQRSRYYVYDTDPPSADDIAFTLGVGWHKIVPTLVVRPKVTPAAVFQQEFPLVRHELALSHIYHEFNGENFGHFLADVMLPIFATMAGFGELTRDVQLFRYQVVFQPSIALPRFVS